MLNTKELHFKNPSSGTMLTFLSIVLDKTNSDIFFTINLLMKIKAVQMTLSINTLFIQRIWSRLTREENTTIVVYKDSHKAANTYIL